MEKLRETVARIVPPDVRAMAWAQRRLDDLTKPPGSLGVLEKMARQIAGITGQPRPALPEKTCILMAGDHGVTEEGVSSYPSEVTAQMVLNFLAGGAAMSVLARHAGARLVVVDVGVKSDLPQHPLLLGRKVAHGTANMALGPAMTREQAVAALEVGIGVAEECIRDGAGILGTGEMGIGNTTPSTAIVALYRGCNVAEVCGRGTGLNSEQLKRKISVIEKALAVNRPDPGDPLDVLAKVGGLEIAALAGVMLAAAAGRVPVVVDGFISGAAALIAAAIAPVCREYMIASHLSEEPGHKMMLELLGLEPCLHMNMRLGEGTGAALAMLLIDGAIKIINEMATFSEAGVARSE